MKRSLKVSGLLSALSLSLFGVSVVGCSAEGTPDGEALGTTSQALNTFTPTGTGVPTDLQFMGEYKLNASSVLVIGGFLSNGTATNTAGILRNTAVNTGTWTRLVDGSSASNPLPSNLGEVEIAQITASKYLVAGGRPSRDASATISAWILTLNVTTAVASWSRFNMAQKRVIGKNNLQRCGTSSHYIAIGGITKSGMISTAAPAVTNTVEVFNYNPANQALSSWSSLKLGSNPAKTVYLPAAQGYHEVLHVSDTDFRVAGGATASASAIISVRSLQVNSSCQALDTSVVSTGVASPLIKTSATSMGVDGSGTGASAARARASSIKPSFTLTISGTTYDFILAGGNDATGGRFSTTPPTRILFYSSSLDSWYNNSTAKSLTDGRLFSRLVIDDSNPTTAVKLGTGVVGNGTSTLLSTTPSSTNTISSAAAIAAGPTLTSGRVGSAVQWFGRTVASPVNTPADYAAFGTAYSAGPTAKADVFDF